MSTPFQVGQFVTWNCPKGRSRTGGERVKVLAINETQAHIESQADEGDTHPGPFGYWVPFDQLTPEDRPEFTFDGFGINGPDKYRTRVATFSNSTMSEQYGKRFEQALNGESYAAGALRRIAREIENETTAETLKRDGYAAMQHRLSEIAYDARVCAYEAEGLTRSDAQSVVDVELCKP